MQVIAYVWAPEEEGQFQPGRASRWWLYHSLKTLEKQIEARGGFICYRRGAKAVDQLLQLCKEVSASAVYFNNSYDPLSLVRDHEVKSQLNAASIAAHNFNAELLYEPWTVLDDNGCPFTTFEAFWHRISNMPKRPATPSFTEPPAIPTISDPCLRRLKLDDLMLITTSEKWGHAHFSEKWTPGTMAGLMLLVEFLDNRLPDFDENRAKVDRDSTSRLSPYIHFGEVSVRVIYHEVKQREAGLQKRSNSAVPAFLKQLAYREYSRYLSFHFPFTHERSLLEHVRAVPWIHCPVRFKAWRQGMTGYPIVDAAMRQLWVTGWMHNRARVFTASFLVKNLLLPWQWGLKHFWDMLLDADLECDALGWQYVAGCLRDAHPFTYLMDFEVESRRFDPDGAYVRKWVPELAQVPLEHIHHPWDAPEAVLSDAGVVLGVEYPVPLISISESRAAVDHAYGVVQKCMYVRSLEPEPYQLPTAPIKMKLLEPEEEVEQQQPATGPMSLSQEGYQSETSIHVLLKSTQQPHMHVNPQCEGTVLRKEQIPPSCVLPELPDVCKTNQSPSSPDLSSKASCIMNLDEGDRVHSHSGAALSGSESRCVNVHGNACLHSDVLSPSRGSMNHQPNMNLPQTACSADADNGAQQVICASAQQSCQGASVGNTGRDDSSRCASDEQINCSSSKMYIQVQREGSSQVKASSGNAIAGACADEACAPAAESSRTRKAEPLWDKRESETTCFKLQKVAPNSSSECKDGA